MFGNQTVNTACMVTVSPQVEEMSVRPGPGCAREGWWWWWWCVETVFVFIRTDRAVLTVSHTVVISIQVRQVALSLLLTAAELLLACCQTHNDNNNTLWDHIQLWNFAREIERCDWSMSAKLDLSLVGVSRSDQNKEKSRAIHESLGGPEIKKLC